MIDRKVLDSRPIAVVIAGSNGAGKSTFYQSHLANVGLRFINADELAAQLGIAAYEAAEATAAIRDALISKQESFIFETLLSDPVGDKIDMLCRWVDLGYTVVMIFISIDRVEISIERVSMRVAKGGHDVPDEKLLSRFERIQANLQRAINRLPHVIIFDNSKLDDPSRHVATYQNGVAVKSKE